MIIFCFQVGLGEGQKHGGVQVGWEVLLCLGTGHPLPWLPLLQQRSHTAQWSFPSSSTRSSHRASSSRRTPKTLASHPGSGNWIPFLMDSLALNIRARKGFIFICLFTFERIGKNSTMAAEIERLNEQEILS